MENGRHILGTFDNALDALRNDVLVMASLTARSLGNAMFGLLQRDSARCATAIADDNEIDELEKQVDRDGFQLMVKFQPVASDLRRVVAAMKISGNLERVADQATNIARRARKLNQSEPVAELAQIEPLYQHAESMLADATRAFSESDSALALSVRSRDKPLDVMTTDFAAKLTQLMEHGGPSIALYLSMIFISRHLERIGDHAANIAEDVIFACEAEDVRHTAIKP